MRRNRVAIAAAAALILSLPYAQAQEPRPRAKAAAPKAQPADDAAMAQRLDQLLKAWEGQSTILKTLQVRINRTDKVPGFGAEQFEGRAILKSPNFVYLHFDKLSNQNGKVAKVGAEQIRCTGTEVWQYKFDTQHIFIYPLDREARKRALEEGPLPFLFNMRATDAKARYTMQLMKEDEKSYVISVVPKLEIDKDSFSKAFVQLDRKFLLPIRIFLVAPDGQKTTDYVLDGHDANSRKPLDERLFQGQTVRGWQVVRNPGDAPAPNAAPRDNRQPALRNGGRAGRG